MDLSKVKNVKKLCVTIDLTIGGFKFRPINEEATTLKPH